MDEQTDSFEAALAFTQAQVDSALKATSAVGKDLKKARTSAVGGQVRDLRKALDAAVTAAEEALTAAREAQASYTVDETELLSSGAYAKELLALAAERGVAMVEEDERLLCYPSLIKVLPGDAALEIDRRKDRKLRPSVVLDALAAAQNRPPRFNAKVFLESLVGGYDLLAQREALPDPVIRLDAVWAVLTLLPGQAKEYSRPEFARDLYQLDQSPDRMTKSGRTLHWHASTGTRGTGVLTTVAKTGQQQRYWGLSFS